MNRKNYCELIKESAEELEALEKRQQQAQARDRVRFLRNLKTGKATTQAEAGELIGLGLRQSQNLWRLYVKQGLSGLLDQSSNKWYFGKLSSYQYGVLLKYLDRDQAVTQQDIKEFLATEFNVHFTQSGISRLCKRLKIKNKTGRPSNVRKDEQGAEEFKKNFIR